MKDNPDLIIVGAGLSGLLTAWRCLDVNPDLRVMIIEASDQIGGDHTWSFNLSDIPEGLQDWIKPFIAHQWPRYEVRFPKYTRTLEIPYCTGNSDTLRACVQPYIKEGRLHAMTGAYAKEVNSESVILEDDTVIEGCVLDARGFERSDGVFIGYQKFVGHTIRTREPHGLEHPVIMDATVNQIGGYRFVYCLPFSEDEVLIEDTYYTDRSDLSEKEISARIKDYIAVQGWEVERIIREEKGVLPITLAAEFKRLEREDESPRIGVRGGFYHAVTSYSLPSALDTTKLLSCMPLLFDNFLPIDASVAVDTARASHWKNERFFRLLNRMLFRAAEPQERYKVLQRFYGLSEGLIKRFYAGTLTRRDKIRILIGKPPVPISKALYNFSEGAFIRRERKKPQDE